MIETRYSCKEQHETRSHEQLRCQRMWRRCALVAAWALGPCLGPDQPGWSRAPVRFFGASRAWDESCSFIHGAARTAAVFSL